MQSSVKQMANNPQFAGMNRADRSVTTTTAGRALQLIRSEILRGRLRPNSRLRLEELRSRYALGLSPIREALLKLQAVGLVIQEDMRGFRVAPVSLDHLRDLTTMRVEIESLGLKWAIERGDIDWEAEILATFHRLSRHRKTDESNLLAIDEGWFGAHRDFHESLIAACGSKLLISMAGALLEQAERYVAISIQYLDVPRDDNSEHETLMQAVLDHDAKKACKLCSSHIWTTTNKVIASYNQMEETEEPRRRTRAGHSRFASA